MRTFDEATGLLWFDAWDTAPEHGGCGFCIPGLVRMKAAPGEWSVDLGDRAELECESLWSTAARSVLDNAHEAERRLLRVIRREGATGPVLEWDEPPNDGGPRPVWRAATGDYRMAVVRSGQYGLSPPPFIGVCGSKSKAEAGESPGVYFTRPTLVEAQAVAERALFHALAGVTEEEASKAWAWHERRGDGDVRAGITTPNEARGNVLQQLRAGWAESYGKPQVAFATQGQVDAIKRYADKIRTYASPDAMAETQKRRVQDGRGVK